MAYRELPPPRGLEPWVECAWEQEAGETPVRVVPDGCIDLVWLAGRGALIAGPDTTAYVVAAAPGDASAGVRLHPGAAGALLGLAPEGLRDARVPVAEAWGAAGRELEEALAAAAGGPPARRLLEDAIAGRAAGAAAPDPAVTAAVGLLGRPGARVPEVAEAVGYSERQLRRRVTGDVGYGPKLLGRVLRLRRALAAAGAGDDLGRVAADAGYADQAHFSGDCRELAGVPPSAFRPVA